MNIEAECLCGAKVKIEMSEEYINAGGRADDKGRIVVAEVILDRWREDHKECVASRCVAIESEVAARGAAPGPTRMPIQPEPPAPAKEPEPAKEYPEAAFAARVKKMLEFHTEVDPTFGNEEVALFGFAFEDNITWGELRAFVKRAGL